MLNTLRKLIGNRKALNTSNQLHNPNFVTDSDKIIKYIEAIAASYQLCTVTIKGSNKIFSTSLIDFRPEQNLLVLDELSPIDGNSLLQSVKEIKLSAFVNSIPFACNLDILSHGLKQGIPYYTAGMPNRIFYPQRRKAPRIFIDKTNIIHFRGPSHIFNIPFTGVVYDLSRGGLCANIENLSVFLERGDIVKNCLITLPDEYVIKFDLAIRTVKMLREHKTQIGGYFLNMPPKSKRKLDHHIAQLERATIRKQKN